MKSAPGVVLKTHVLPRAWEAWQRGQSLVELALITPVLLMVTIGTVDFSRIMYAYVTVVNAANAGAQYAATSTITAADTAGIVAAALRDTTSLPGPSPSVTVSGPAGDGQGDGFDQVSVSVHYTFTVSFPVPLGLSPSIPISDTAIMRVVPRT